MAEARQVHDPGTRSSGDDLGEEELGKEKMTDVIRRELDLESILVGGIFFNAHDTGIVDQDVKLGDLIVDGGCGGADGVEVVKGDGDEVDFDGRIYPLDTGDDGLDAPLRSGEKNQVLGLGGGKSHSSLSSETFLACTSDNDCSACQ